MLHSLKANLVNLQDENKQTLHADSCMLVSAMRLIVYA